MVWNWYWSSLRTNSNSVVCYKDAAGAGEGKGSASSLTTDERRHAHRIIPTHSSGSVKGGAEMPKKTSTAFVIPRPATILSG